MAIAKISKLKATQEHWCPQRTITAFIYQMRSKMGL